MRKLFTLLLTMALICVCSAVYAKGNQTFQSFNKAKRALERQVYFDHRVTLYCGAEFDAEKRIDLPEGFTTPKHEKRALRVEWEHVVPAENFGRTFSEWREGHPECVNRNGTTFKGRKCAEKMNTEYRYMQSDMYNLYPAIGAVNAMRLNYNFQMLGESVSSTFGSCPMKIEGRRAEPPTRARGQIARTYKYMQAAYSRYSMSRQQNQLMDAWDRMYPVDEWECRRSKRIEKIQGNENPFVKEPCMKVGLW